MSLELPIIDDVTWRDLNAASQRIMARVSGGRWTHHGPSDVGVTIAEQQAWISEQQIFAYDHLTPEIRRALLALMGIEPRPARSARTVMQVCTGSEEVIIDEGVVFTRPELRPPVKFTTVHGVTALPHADIGLIIDARDRRLDLQRGMSVRMLPVDGIGELELRVWCTAPPPSASEQPVTLLFLLRTPGGATPGWMPRSESDGIATEVPAWPGPMLDVEWSYETAAGFQRFDVSKLHDGTDGFRRSGVVRLPFPTAWVPMDHRAAGPWPFRLRVRARVPAGVAPPVLDGLALNAVEAEHRWWSSCQLWRSRLPLPGEVIELPTEGAPVLARGVVATLAERDGINHQWRPVADVSRFGPQDRVFAVDRIAGRLLFGDGRTGRQPTAPPGGGVAAVAFPLGGGSAGNIAVGTEWLALDSAGERAVALVDGVGGREPESLDAAERRAAAMLNRPERALTIADIEHLARTTPGLPIARAHAIVGHDPSRVHVAGAPGITTVIVVPHGHFGGTFDGESPNRRAHGPVPDRAAVVAIARRLERRRPIGMEMRVRPPCYRQVELRCTVEGSASLRSDFFASLEQALSRFLDPIEGGETGGGWPFGGALIPSALMSVAQRAVSDRATVTDLEMRFAETDGSWVSCDLLALAEFELPLLIDVILRLHPPQRRSGGLR